MDDQSGEIVDPFDDERQLRELLKGRRMVFELGFDEDEFRRWRRPLILALRRNTVEELRYRAPALLVTYMSYVGTFLYEGGDYWSNLHPALLDDPAETGRHFVGAVERLELESFEDIVLEERAHRWVSRVLAQGGIPRSCMEPFAELVWREVASGVADGAELLANWRTRQASLTGLHAPTRRFLLYGGNEATDLVDRCVEWCRDSSARGDASDSAVLGLPGYVVEALATAEKRRPTRATGATRDGVSVPRFRLDPYDALGPVVVLPPVATDQLGGVWRVQSGGRVHRQEPSSYSSETVKVSPSAAANVEFLTSDGLRREWTFEILAAGSALFFDPDNQDLLRGFGALAADETWVLLPERGTILSRGTSGNEPAPEIQRLPAPLGAWSGWTIRHLDLRNCDALLIDDRSGVERTVRVVSPRARPELVGVPVAGVTAEGDAEVYGELPSLQVPRVGDGARWSIHLRGPEGDRSLAVQSSEDGLVDLASLASATRFGVYRVRVRGPIGSDMTKRFAVVEGLEVSRPARTVMPGDGAPVVTVEAPETACDDGPPGKREQVSLPETATFAPARLRHKSGRTLDITVAVPRLLWTIVHDTKPALQAGTHVVSVDAGEFDDQLADTLLLQVGRPDIPISVELRDRDGTRVQELPSVTTVSGTGSWAFDLGPFADTIRRAGGARMSIHAFIGAHAVRMADIVSVADIHSIRAIRDADNVMVVFDEGRSVPHRVVRLWSLYQPWQPPIEIKIPDGANSATSPIDESMTPGNYHAHISVEDPWREPVRPSAQQPGVFPVTLGTRAEIQTFLGNLDPHEPRSLITWALARYRGESRFETDALVSCAQDIALALGVLIDGLAAGQPSSRELESISSVASASEPLLTAVVGSAAELEGSDTWLQRLDVRLAAQRLPAPAAADDTTMATVWRLCPGLATRLDLQRADDEQARDRLKRFLGWAPGDGPPEPSGAQVEQLALQLPEEQLRDLRFMLGIQPAGLLDPATRQLATFEWLLQNQVGRHSSADDLGEPDRWYQQFAWLLDEPVAQLPAQLHTSIDDHWDARMPPYGTETRAAVPALLWAAAVMIRFSTSPQLRATALQALETALPWGGLLIGSDQALLTVFEMMNGTNADH